MSGERMTSLSIYSTNHEEKGALGDKLTKKCAVLLFALTVVRIQEGGDNLEATPLD